MPSAADPRVTGPSGTGVHLLIPTHTTRHLDTCLAAISLQSEPPDSVVVTCDTDSGAIGDLLDRTWPRVGDRLRRKGSRVPRLLHVQRAHQGEPRLNQVRNNGLRALLDSGAHQSSLVVTIDGDMALSPDAVAAHRKLAAAGADVIVAFRVNLSESRTQAIDAEKILKGGEAEWMQIEPDLLDALTRRDRRYRRQLLLRQTLPWLSKSHKPKLLGGHHAVRLNALLAVNGYDEEFTGYGYDDDDLARRLHLLGGLSWSIAVSTIPAFHLWHPTRAPTRPTDAPGFARFSRRDLPVRTERGIASPLSQPLPVVRQVPCES